MQPAATRSSSLNFVNVATRFDHAPDDLVSGHAWIRRKAPLISRDMQVRVADSAKKNFNLHISRCRLAPFERERLQRLVRRVGGITFSRKHVIDPLPSTRSFVCDILNA